MMVFLIPKEGDKVKVVGPTITGSYRFNGSSGVLIDGKDIHTVTVAIKDGTGKVQTVYFDQDSLDVIP
jgi:hypothetical protein